MKKLVLFLGVIAAAAVLAVPAALAKEIGSGSPVTPPTPAPVTAPCATVTSVSVLGKKVGGEPAFGFAVSGDYAVTSCSTLAETVVIHVNFSNWATGELLQSYDAETTPLLAGKGTKGLLHFGGLPQRTTFKVEIVVTDAATGALLASRWTTAGTPAAKV